MVWGRLCQAGLCVRRACTAITGHYQLSAFRYLTACTLFSAGLSDQSAGNLHWHGASCGLGVCCVPAMSVFGQVVAPEQSRRTTQTAPGTHAASAKWACRQGSALEGDGEVGVESGEAKVGTTGFRPASWLLCPFGSPRAAPASSADCLASSRFSSALRRCLHSACR